MSVSINDPYDVANDSANVGGELVARGEYLLRIGRELLKQSELLRGKAPGEVKPLRPTGPSGDHSVNRLGHVIDINAASGVARTLHTFTRIAFQDALGTDGIQTSKWMARLHEANLIERGTDDEGAIVYTYSRDIDDEPASYQLHMMAKQRGAAQPFTIAEAMEHTGLSEDEVVTGLAELSSTSIVEAEQIDEVADLDEVGELGGVQYRFVPPISDGAASELERRRLGSVSAPVVVKRGEPVRIRTERKQRRARSTPGTRQKVVNTEREYARMVAAREERARNIAAKNKARKEKDKTRRSARKKRTEQP